MKKSFLLAPLVLSAVAAVGAGTLAARQAVHVIGKVGPPIIPATTPVAPNPPLTSSQLISKLKLMKFPANTLSGPIHFDAANLVANTNNYMQVAFGFVNPMPNGGYIVLGQTNRTSGVIIYHQASANVPFIVDFQISSESGGTTFQSQGGSSSQTWSVSGPMHAIVAAYPTSGGLYMIYLNCTQGIGVINGVDVTDVTS